MTVGSFDPSALSNPLDDAEIDALLVHARTLEGEDVGLAEADIARFAPLATHADWASHLEKLSDADLEHLIRLFTLAEMQYSSWVAGDKSPVVPMVRALKARGSYDVGLTRWIKSHSNNKFLPHGSLLDRL